MKIPSIKFWINRFKTRNKHKDRIVYEMVRNISRHYHSNIWTAPYCSFEDWVRAYYEKWDEQALYKWLNALHWWCWPTRWIAKIYIDCLFESGEKYIWQEFTILDTNHYLRTF